MSQSFRFGIQFLDPLSERNLIRERTMAGFKAACARGRKGGRFRKLHGKDLKIIRGPLLNSLKHYLLLMGADLPQACLFLFRIWYLCWNLT
jgi:DNA invertase Pin-like site-specific DNA recombinase